MCSRRSLASASETVSTLTVADWSRNTVTSGRLHTTELSAELPPWANPPPAGFAWYPLDLRGRALHFTVDISRIPCGCHGEVVFRPLLQDWSAAVHLQANMAAVQAVVKTPGEQPASEIVHVIRNIGATNATAEQRLYGPTALIDTGAPFGVAIGADAAGALFIELSQGSPARRVTLSDGAQELPHALKTAMAQMWTQQTSLQVALSCTQAAASAHDAHPMDGACADELRPPPIGKQVPGTVLSRRSRWGQAQVQTVAAMLLSGMHIETVESAATHVARGLDDDDHFDGAAARAAAAASARASAAAAASARAAAEQQRAQSHHVSHREWRGAHRAGHQRR